MRLINDAFSLFRPDGYIFPGWRIFKSGYIAHRFKQLDSGIVLEVELKNCIIGAS
jgi:hypothetical protein